MYDRFIYSPWLFKITWLRGCVDVLKCTASVPAVFLSSHDSKWCESQPQTSESLLSQVARLATESVFPAEHKVMEKSKFVLKCSLLCRKSTLGLQDSLGADITPVLSGLWQITCGCLMSLVYNCPDSDHIDTWSEGSSPSLNGMTSCLWSEKQAHRMLKTIKAGRWENTFIFFPAIVITL